MTGLSDARWVKSSFSVNDGACVELAGLPGGRVAVRDSKNPHGAVLIFTQADLAAFVHGVKHGEFDHPTD